MSEERCMLCIGGTTCKLQQIFDHTCNNRWIWNVQVGGGSGANALGRLLAERGVELEYLMDEGLVIITGLVPGISKPVAL